MTPAEIAEGRRLLAADDADPDLDDIAHQDELTDWLLDNAKDLLDTAEEHARVRAMVARTRAAQPVGNMCPNLIATVAGMLLDLHGYQDALQKARYWHVRAEARAEAELADLREDLERTRRDLDTARRGAQIALDRHQHASTLAMEELSEQATAAEAERDAALAALKGA